MKFAIHFFLLLCLILCGSCSNKQKKFQPEATNDHEVAIIGSADGPTEIVIGEDSYKQDRDTVIYEIPQCKLWYTKGLSEADKGKEIRMWTERKEYWKDVQVINVFVANPTDAPINFGRHWNIYKSLILHGKMIYLYNIGECCCIVFAFPLESIIICPKANIV